MGIGKTGGNSWLTSVKRAFRSPTKLGSAKKTCKRADEDDNDQGEKKTEKRKWIFSKLTSPTKKWEEKQKDTVSSDEERRAIAAAEASTEAAKVAVAKAKAAVNKSVVNVKQTRLAVLLRQHYAALVIQTAFRGYLARQALRALKGIVKLQALVRGHNVRTQAKAALKCMQALISVQAKMRDQYSRPVEAYGTRKSMFAESNNLWDKYKDIRQRNSITLDEGNVEDQWEDRPYTIEDIEAMLKSKQEAALKREKALAYALSQQIRRSERNQSMINEKEANNNTGWLKQWMESEQFRENDKRSMSQRRDSIKDIDIDSLLTPQTRRHSLHVASPRNYGSTYHSPMTPSFKQLHVQSASPRCHSTTTTPSLRSNCPSTVSSYSYRTSTGGPPTTMPNYMAATESAKAKARSQSTPRHRSSMSERSDRGGSIKKRLSFPALPESHSDCTHVYNEYSGLSENLRSPSFRSVQGGGYGVEGERRSLCSCCTERV